MAEKRTTITQFITRTLLVFSFVMLFLMVLGPLVGDDAQGISSLFALGTQGIPYFVVLQALVLALCANTLGVFFMSNLFFKKMMLLWRTILMLTSVLFCCGILSILFGWFPANNPLAWVFYLVSFSVAAGLSSLVMVLKTRHTNAQVNKKLEEYIKHKQAETTSGKGD